MKFGLSNRIANKKAKASKNTAPSKNTKPSPGEKTGSDRNKAPKSSNSKIAFPKFIEPMKARLVAQPPSGKWVYEIKFDGFRALAFKNGDATTLLSRNDKDFSKRFPTVRDAVSGLDVENAIFDGEIVAVDQQGRSSFQLLQASDLGQEKPPIVYYVFDLLYLRGEDLQHRPLLERKEILKSLLPRNTGVVRFSESLDADVKTLLKHAQKLDLEGLIAKRADSIYEPGSRSGAWIKLKLHHEQEMVIGGYTDPEGGRKHFGSLIVGYYEKSNLLCAGKVGTGFNDALLRSLFARFKSLESSACPFSNLPEKRSGRYGAGITPAQMRRCHWLKPELVCQVKFSEWTRDGKLRQPVFLGLRDDKEPKDVVREKPA
jgi:bifunctional non-homologous end joining protein LigD